MTPGPPSGTRAGPALITATALILGLAAALASAPAAADHPDADTLDHLSLTVKDLEPQDTDRIPIESTTHGHLREGWIYILYSYVQRNHSLDVTLYQDDDEADGFTWQAGSFNAHYTKIAKTGPHTLAVTNNGNETVRYGFYYDQSCNCDGKQIPLPGGVVMFNYPFQAGTQVDIAYPVASPAKLDGKLAVHDEDLPTADWPDDFEILDEQQAQGPWRQNGDDGWLNFTFTADETRTYYVHVQAIEGGSPEAPIMLSPIIDTVAAQKAPGPIAIFVALGGLAAACALRRFRPNA